MKIKHINQEVCDAVNNLIAVCDKHNVFCIASAFRPATNKYHAAKAEGIRLSDDRRVCFAVMVDGLIEYLSSEGIDITLEWDMSQFADNDGDGGHR